MSPSNRTIKVGGVWAEGAIDPPATPVQSTTYADSGVTEGEIQAGWPFADIVESAKFNEVMRRITSLIKLAEEWGVLSWNSSTTYATKALVMGSNGEIYYCKVASSTGNDPTTSPTQWGLAFEASGSVSTHAGLASPHSGQTPKTSSGSTTNTVDATGHTHAISAASETSTGAVELATAAETTAGTDNTRAVHPAGLKVELDKKAPLASPALTGTPTAPTAPADTSTAQVASTAFVTGQAGANAPKMDGAVAVGVSKRYSREDHIHPTDTTRAPVASPALTGTPTAPTAPLDTSTTQIATTAFVTNQAGTAAPAMDGTATVGTSKRYSRQDHRHPTDNTRAPLASPALTGTPTAPTAANGTNTAQLATTAFAYGVASKAANGYQKLPSGLIIQWGRTASAVSGSHVLNFPVAFPSACLGAVACKNATVDNYAGHVSAFSATQLTLYVSSNAAYMYWMAIGY